MPTLIAPSGHALALPRLPCRIGTATTNDVPIQGGLGVAGHHVTFTQENGAVVIEDSGSGLGTFINGAPVHRQALRGGESVRIGSLELKFEHDGPQASPPGAVLPPANAAVPATQPGEPMTQPG